MTASPDAVLVVEALEKRFDGRRSLPDLLRRRPAPPVRAVDGISFSLAPAEVLALVGESGSGKTTTAQLLLGLLPPSAGRVEVAGHRLERLGAGELRRLRRDVQLVFQDPYESLNPRMSVGEIVAEPLHVHRLGRGRDDVHRRVLAALAAAGLQPPQTFLHRRPLELSGGQRQRVAIAAALVLGPKILVADEPVSMLDVSIRAEILNLLAQLAREEGIAVVLITHDLATVAAYAHRIAVMYLGRIVETGPVPDVLRDPQHPYTRALLSVVPVADPERRRPRVILEGETPDAARVPSGCRFHPRCPEAFGACPRIDPQLYGVSGDREAACLLVAPEGLDPEVDAHRGAGRYPPAP